MSLVVWRGGVRTSFYKGSKLHHLINREYKWCLLYFFKKCWIRDTNSFYLPTILGQSQWRVSWTLNSTPHQRNCWLGKVRERREYFHQMRERSFIPTTPSRHNYQVSTLANSAMKLCLRMTLVGNLTVCGTQFECVLLQYFLHPRNFDHG